MIDQNNYNNDDDKNYHNIDIDNITGIQLHLQRHHDRGETWVKKAFTFPFFLVYFLLLSLGISYQSCCPLLGVSKQTCYHIFGISNQSYCRSFWYYKPKMLPSFWHFLSNLLPSRNWEGCALQCAALPECNYWTWVFAPAGQIIVISYHISRSNHYSHYQHLQFKSMQARQFCILTIIVMINRDCGMLPQVCLPFGLAGSQRHLGGKILYFRSLKNLPFKSLRNRTCWSLNSSFTESS